MELEELGEPLWVWQAESDQRLDLSEEAEPAWVDAYEF